MITASQLVSIGMPVYNGEKFLREAIDSLLEQSFFNFELIISDNASSDATEEICQSYLSIDKRVRYIRQADNIGALANFQVVLNESRGDFFMWAACDDKWDSDWLELLCTRLMDSEAISTFGRVKQIDESSDVIRNHVANSNLFDFSGNYLKRRVSFFLEFEGKGKANLFYSLYKREFLQQVNLVSYQQDYYVLFDLLRRTNFVSVDNVFLYKRIHNTNAGAVRPKSRLDKLLDVITLKTIYRSFLVAKGYLPYTSGVESLIIIALIPAKIFLNHIFYIQRIFKR